MSLVKFIGVGHYCPENIVTNNQLSEIVDTSHEWIIKRTGICHRRISSGEGTVDLAVNATKHANFFDNPFLISLFPLQHTLQKTYLS